MNELAVIEYQGSRVLTTQQLAQVYECGVINIQQNFNNHQTRFTEGQHFFKLEGEELKAFKRLLDNIEEPSIKFAPVLILWTKRGANRHCKILDTDKAWQQFDRLEETYFQVKAGEIASYTIEDPIQRAEKWIEEQKEKQLLKLQNSQQSQIINELKPKADYTDLILKNKGLVTITQIAKDYGMSGKTMNKLLHDLKVQYKQSGQWLLYKDIQHRGFTHSETTDFKHKDGTSDVNMLTKWTQKGRLYLYDLLKQHGVFPLIEQ